MLEAGRRLKKTYLKNNELPSQPAELELREAFLWYEEQKEGLGEVFQYNIHDAFIRINENPLLFQIKYDNIRVIFLDVFPFGIHYIVKEKEILIISVYHTSRKPRKC